MKAAWMILGMVAVLIGLAFFIPSNSLTGNVVKEGPCGEVGCSELCEMEGPNTCGGGMTCCQTHWDSGVCEYSVNCEKIREYSVYQTIETYQDSVREQPAPVDADWKRFFFPLLLTLGLVGYFILKRKEK